MTKHHLVEAISSQTGISKRDLAQWIGTHHSILSRYLAGTRSLPLKAVQQLLFLHQQLADLPELLPAEPVETNTTDWKQQAADCSARLSNLQTRYAAVCLGWQTATKALQLLAALAADTVMLTPKKERWIAEQRYLAEKQAADNNLAARQRLQVQIILLQKEVELYEALAGNIKITPAGVENTVTSIS